MMSGVNMCSALMVLRAKRFGFGLPKNGGHDTDIVETGFLIGVN